MSEKQSRRKRNASSGCSGVARGEKNAKMDNTATEAIKAFYNRMTSRQI